MLSARSIERSLGAALGIAMTALLAACSTTGSVEPEGRETAAVTADDSQAREAAPGEESRRERRRRRRDREAEPTADAELAIQVPERANAAYLRAVAAMEVENWLEAELELEQLILDYPEFPGPFVNLAIIYMHDGRSDDAMEALEEALAIEPMHAAANNQLGILLRERGEFGASEEAYRRAIATDPEYALAHYNLGVLLDLYLRRSDEALALYERYQSFLPEPDQQVGRWIIDLRRRLGAQAPAAVAQEGG